MRLATWNVEWFNALFDDQGRLWADDAPSARYGVTRGAQTRALTTVFRALDADAVMVIEAPDTNARRSTVRALEHFAEAAGLRARRALTGFRSETEQEIALLYDPSRLSARHDPWDSADAPRFDGLFRVDLDGDGLAEEVRFSKPPLEVALTLPDRRLRLIGVHAKSKGRHGHLTEAEAMRQAIENRRKQLAECLWLRARVDQLLAAGESVIVLGDLNDGPGLDEFERLFGRSGVEVVLGSALPPERRLYDPYAVMELGQRIGAAPTTARFFVPGPDHWLEALLDFIMVSADLRGAARDWRIWHPLDDKRVVETPGLAEALLAASDHFPVVLELG